MKIEEYKCPACTGPLRYDGKSGKLHCDYCGSDFDVAAVQEANRREAEKEGQQEKQGEEKYEEDYTGPDGADAGTWEDSGMVGYTCRSCGAELVTDETTAASRCPYCGNNTIFRSRLEGKMRPNYILPFQTGKEDAVRRLKSYYKGKHFLPSAFAEENNMQEIRGVYVPFWVFDGIVDADIIFDVTKTRMVVRGQRQAAETEHFSIRKQGSVPFEKLPVNASSRMPDAHMETIEPFRNEDIKPFSTAYMPGFLADQYDIGMKDCLPKARKRAEDNAVEFLGATVSGYDTCVEKSRTLIIRNERASYALLPVWMLTTRWKDKTFLFAMNGQTGAFTGNLPIDPMKVLRWFLVLTVPFFALAMLVGMLYAGEINSLTIITSVIFGMVVSGLTCQLIAAGMKPTGKKTGLEKEKEKGRKKAAGKRTK